MSNVGATRTVAGSMDDEGAALRALPPAIRAFVEERAAVPFAPSQVAGYFRANGEAATLKKLRELSNAELARAFGENYPFEESK